MGQNNYIVVIDPLVLSLIKSLILAGDVTWLVIGVVAGSCLVIGLVNANKLRGKILIVFSLIFSLVQPLIFYFPEIINSYGIRYSIYNRYFYEFVWGVILSIVTVFLALSIYMSPIEKIRSILLKRKNSFKDSKTDIRAIDKHLLKVNRSCDSEKYMCNKNKLFIGMGDNRKPLKLDRGVSTSHIHIMGTTGAGKTVSATNILMQCIKHGESVVVIDPKDDEYLPHALGQAAKREGVKFIYLELLGNTPQWNPFNKKSLNEIEEILSAGFGLSDSGEGADFYRLQDRKAARLFARHVQESGGDLLKIYIEFIANNSDINKDAPKFLDELSELVSLRVTNITEGINISEAIAKGCVIYVHGSMRNPRALKLQKMFLMSVIHACERRDRNGARHVRIFLDEFKYLISKPALEALGSIRDKKASMILANQSYGDLRSCPKDIDPESVISSVSENCAVKIVYKIRDPDTAERLARLSGTILVPDEVVTIKGASSMLNPKKPDISIRNTERFLIDTNMLLSLPPGCAVLYGKGTAELISVFPIKVDKKDEYIQSTRFDVSPFESNMVDKNDFYSCSSISIAEGLLDVD